MAEYEVTSDLLSRPRGETFTDDELGAVNVAALVAGGHLTEKQDGRPAAEAKPAAEATEKKG